MTILTFIFKCELRDPLNPGKNKEKMNSYKLD